MGQSEIVHVQLVVSGLGGGEDGSCIRSCSLGLAPTNQVDSAGQHMISSFLFLTHRQKVEVCTLHFCALSIDR